MKTTWIILVCLLVGVLFASAFSEQYEYYFPLQVGNKWIIQKQNKIIQHEISALIGRFPDTYDVWVLDPKDPVHWTTSYYWSFKELVGSDWRKMADDLTLEYNVNTRVLIGDEVNRGSAYHYFRFGGMLVDFGIPVNGQYYTLLGNAKVYGVAIGPRSEQLITKLSNDSTITCSAGTFHNCMVFSDGTAYAPNVGPVNGLLYAKVNGIEYGNLQTAVEHAKINSVPETCTLLQNYPNPFNPITTIEFSLTKPEQVSLKILTLLGQQVAGLVDGRMAAGLHKVTWNAGDLANGVYYYILQAGNYREVRKAILMK